MIDKECKKLEREISTSMDMILMQLDFLENPGTKIILLQLRDKVHANTRAVNDYKELLAERKRLQRIETERRAYQSGH